MKYLLSFIFLFVGSGIAIFGQNTADFVQGNVSFISSQNVYVRFVNTDGINNGDTLYILRNNKLSPVLVVKEKSSISCVGNALSENTLSVTSQVFAHNRTENKPIEVIAEKSKEALSVNDIAIENASAKKTDVNKLSTNVGGRVSLSSYLNNTSDSTINKTTRLNLALNVRHIAKSKISAELYLSLTNKNRTAHQYKQVVDAETNDTTNALITVPQTTNELRVYNLSLSYDFDSTSCLTLGRKINANLANVGAVDGLQFEKTGRSFSYGAIVGSMPDTYTYGINPKLLQFGAFIGHHTKKGSATSQTSLALFNQMNNMMTDRRFVYLQHSNYLLKNLDFFGSMEVDLYGKVNNQLTTSLNLTSTYLSLNWQPWKKLNFSLSYDARKNVYYYETYKNYVDSLLDKETRQGFRFRTNFRPFKYVTWGLNAGYRLPSTNTGTHTTTAYSANGYTYLTYSQLPLIGASLTLDATALKTPYFTNALMYGGSLSRDFVNGDLFAELSYHYVDFSYITGSTLQQNIGEVSLSWKIAKKLLLSVNFEATQEADRNLQWRSFINLSQRF